MCFQPHLNKFCYLFVSKLFSSCTHRCCISVTFLQQSAVSYSEVVQILKQIHLNWIQYLCSRAVPNCSVELKILNSSKTNVMFCKISDTTSHFYALYIQYLLSELIQKKKKIWIWILVVSQNKINPHLFNLIHFSKSSKV